ncbi:MAG: nicotinate phosphoribosyltransferase [Vicinamibacterales bacterium]
MLQAYMEEGMTARAVFSLFVRRLPEQRNFLLACGLDAVLAFLEQLRFDADALRYLASLDRFSDRFLRWLEDLRFTGDVWAVPEGTPVFGEEPLLEVTAPIAEAQLVEAFVMNQMHLQTLLASKAARVVHAADGRAVVDFGLRRTHGVDAAISAARAFAIAGVTATSNVAAGQLYNLPLAGTLAHSYIQAHDDERDAFRAFTQVFPETALLVDTYDTLEGVRRVVDLARERGPGFRVTAIRLDSGDLGALAVEARRLLDQAQLSHVRIMASGGLDEVAIARLVAAGAPIDQFGVGTDMGVSRDVPGLDMAYKLVEYAGHSRMKLSPGKVLWPGPKQVFRVERRGVADHDVLAQRGEVLDGRPLLRPVMVDGVRSAEGRATLPEAAARSWAELDRLPLPLRELAPARPGYPVVVSDGLVAHREALTRSLTNATSGVGTPWEGTCRRRC